MPRAALPDTGTLAITGRDVRAEAAELRRRIGVVPQLGDLAPDFSASEHLLAPARRSGRPPRTGSAPAAILPAAAAMGVMHGWLALWVLPVASLAGRGFGAWLW